MKKMLFVAAVLSTIFFVNNSLVFAQGISEETKKAGTSKPVGVGNKICPVSGEKIDEKTKATYEYRGKIYNFCCSMCIDEFKKDPQKYIKKIEEETPSAVKTK
jgi:YHS domain-containing protein